MSRIDKLRKQNNMAIQNAKSDLQELHAMSHEADRVADVARDVHIIVEDLDRQFEKATGLQWQDVKFLFFAIALQCIRQYVLTKFPERMDDKTVAKNTWGHVEEHSNRHHRYYNPSLEEIMTNPVPFDANIGANGALAGGGSMGHRVTAIGHDPLLGYIFGTANIATSTLTNHLLQSFHIATENKRDYFRNRASTPLVLIRTKDKLLNEGLEGKKKIAVSLMKEAIHLKSDIGTKHSLPLPMISLVDAQLASALAERGLDMANVAAVGKQSAYAVMINAFIAMIHDLCYDKSVCSRNLYAVRTRKILMYSNTIAAVSNVIITALMACTGAEDAAVRNFDLGGLMVTVYRIVNDRKFIKEIKQEFLANEFYNIVMG